MEKISFTKAVISFPARDIGMHGDYVRNKAAAASLSFASLSPPLLPSDPGVSY